MCNSCLLFDRRIIARANDMLKNDSDRMKTFQSKMVYCDVLAEREAQIELKRELNAIGTDSRGALSRHATTERAKNARAGAA